MRYLLTYESPTRRLYTYAYAAPRSVPIFTIFIFASASSSLVLLLRKYTYLYNVFFFSRAKYDIFLFASFSFAHQLVYLDGYTRINMYELMYACT